MIFLLILSINFVYISAYSLQTIINSKDKSSYIQQTPILTNTLTLQEQIRVYQQTISQYHFKDFVGNPSLNARFTLKKDRASEKLFFIGRQAGTLTFQINVQYIQDGQYKGITLYLINHSDKKIQFSKSFRRSIAYYSDQMNSDLFELRIISNDKSENFKQLTIDALIDVDVVRDIQDPVSKDVNEIQAKILKLGDQTDQLFLTSLVQWDQYTNQMAQQISFQKSVNTLAFLQMLCLIVINIGGFFILRNQINQKILV